MVELNKYKLFISFLIGMYQVKQINYLYSLLDETNNNYNRINKQYQILNKKYDKLNEDIIKLNHTINTINQICSEEKVCEEKVCEEKVCESNINPDFIEKIRLDLDKVDKILQDYEKVDAPVLNYKINDIYPNPNNSIVKMFYTFF